MDLRKIVKDNLYLFVILVLSSLIVWPLFLPGYFSHHDDLQVMRIFEMRRCMVDLQIPCRWVSDMGYGNGYPLFNYYNPFPYYIGGLLSFIFGYIVSVKILFFIAAILGGISMYFLAKEIFGKDAALVAAILYQFAPYKALDLYVRGDLTESFAIAIIPLSFYFAYRLIVKNSIKSFLGLSVSLAAFLTSHNIMTLFFLPLLVLFMIVMITLEKSKNILPTILSLLIGIGLACFFIIPAFFEKNLVQIENLIRLDLNFRAHFATVNQLFFDRTWGYGASIPGPNDTISFQIGWPQWWVVLFSVVFILVTYKKKSSKIALTMLLIFLIAIFMTHGQSAFIWEKIDILKYAQFPWRFLAVAIFSSSLLGGYLVTVLSNKIKIYAILAIIITTVFLNWNYFKPEKFYPNVGDKEKLSGVEWDKQQKAAILDYLPGSALQPREKAPGNPIIILGKVQILDFDNRSNRWSFNAKVLKKSKIEVPVFDFPNWQVRINNTKIPHSQGTIGRITFNLGEGSYKVEGNFENTSIRTVANMITLISLITLSLFILYGKGRKIFR